MVAMARLYDNDERADAVTWLTSLPETARVSVYDLAKAYNHLGLARFPCRVDGPRCVPCGQGVQVLPAACASLDLGS